MPRGRRCSPWTTRPKAAGTGRVIDVDFIEQDTSGFDAFVASVNHFQWPEIEACSGLSRAAIESAARVYGNARAVIACYGMGLTQHLRVQKR